ncbi:epoxide hydrolase 4-like [Pistacia vera]|uniref:epoxide hydrolase 4-like n=1 Tax=Pistacia vera TaxID=55513 RepID=UPI001262DAD2|nr:epoxide hydrolase 4-like [Pistacia vera]
MVNCFLIYKSILNGAMKLVGMTTQAVEIEPGTVLNFWVPTETTNKTKNKTNKPAVVFLHGFAFDGILNWQFQVLGLAKKYAVYVPDFLFFGGSFTDRPERTVEFQSECTARGLRKLGVEKCTLVGLSYGGIVGFKMAEMYPELVESMVVTCAVMALTESLNNAALRRVGFSSLPENLLPKTAEGVKTLLDKCSYRFLRFHNFFYREILETMFNHRKERTELLQALVISDERFTIPHYPQSVTSGIRVDPVRPSMSHQAFTQRRPCVIVGPHESEVDRACPEKMYLLWGENDLIFDIETARSLKEQLGEKATLKAIKKAGHIVNLERQCVYNRNLKRILGSFTQENAQHS